MRLKRIATFMLSGAAAMMLFVSTIAPNLCIQPIWYYEPEMPDCMKQDLLD